MESKEVKIPKLLWGSVLVLTAMTLYVSYEPNEAIRQSRMSQEVAVAQLQECHYSDGNISIYGCPIVLQYVNEIVKKSQGQRIWEFDADCTIEFVDRRSVPELDRVDPEMQTEIPNLISESVTAKQ